jgi:hypothetical protein
MADTESDPERIRVIRELLAEAEGESSHTMEDAVARQGAVTFLSWKLRDAERMQAHGG